MEALVNNEISFSNVLVINSNGENLGIKSSSEALNIANSEGLDLVCISPEATIPVCKILDYGKFKFEQAKKEKTIKKHQQGGSQSEIQLSATIQEHDIQTKVKMTERLINKGNEVKIILKLKGRETNFIDLAVEKIKHFIELCDFAQVKKDVFIEGRDIKAILEKKH